LAGVLELSYYTTRTAHGVQ